MDAAGLEACARRLVAVKLVPMPKKRKNRKLRRDQSGRPEA
jgi:hypothetical protein